MGELLSYMLKSSLVLMAMYLMYKAIMANQKEHAFNRVTLLVIYVIALITPALPELSHIIANLAGNRNVAMDIDVGLPINITLDDSQNATTPLWPFIVLCVYLCGIAIMFILTAISYLKLTHIVRTGQRHTLSSNAVLVISGNKHIAPFSWMKYVVISQNDYRECGSMIMPHELEHLARHHWIDMALAQIIIIFQWFNPAAWLMRDELRTVHEFQADAAVLNSGANARLYQLLLIKKAVGKSFPALANSLNHSNLKKRITMMLKSKPRKSRRMLALALAPAAIAAVAVFNIPAVASAISTVANAKMPENVSGHKVTKSADVLIQDTEEISLPDAISASDTALQTTPAPKSTTESNTKASDNNSSLHLIITVDGNELTPDANGDFEYNGKKYSINSLSNMPSEYVESMEVNRQESTITVNLKGKDSPKKIVGKLPEFPGGEKALFNYIIENIKYPENALQDGETHRVVVSFNISNTGKVGDAKIIRSQGELFDAEAIRIISTLPDFEPAINENGEKVSTTYTLPISFKTVGKED